MPPSAPRILPKRLVGRRPSARKKIFHETDDEIHRAIEIFKAKNRVMMSDPGRAEGSIFARHLNADL